MDTVEREILEIAGAFSFKFSLVPKGWLDSHRTSRQVDKDEHGYAIQTWWQDHQPNCSIRNFCDQYFIPVDSSPCESNLIEQMWTDENFNQIQLWETERDVVADLEIHMDLRFLYVDFLARTVELANQARCSFYLFDEDDFISANSVTVYDALKRSRAAYLAAEQSYVFRTH